MSRHERGNRGRKRSLGLKCLWLFGVLVLAIGVLMFLLFVTKQDRETTRIKQNLLGSWICEGDANLAFYNDGSFFWKFRLEDYSTTGVYTNNAGELELMTDTRGEKSSEKYKYSVIFEADNSILLSGNGLGNEKARITCNRENK